MWGKQRPWQTLSREKTGDTQSARQSKKTRESTRERKRETEAGRSCGMQVESQPEKAGGGERSRHREKRRKTKARHRREMKGEWREEAGVEQERDGCCRRREKQARGGGSGKRPWEVALGGGKAWKWVSWYFMKHVLFKKSAS